MRSDFGYPISAYDNNIDLLIEIPVKLHPIRLLKFSSTMPLSLMKIVAKTHMNLSKSSLTLEFLRKLLLL